MYLEQIVDGQSNTSKYEMIVSKETPFVVEELIDEPLRSSTNQGTNRRMRIEERTAVALRSELQNPQIELNWLAEDGFKKLPFGYTEQEFISLLTQYLKSDATVLNLRGLSVSLNSDPNSEYPQEKNFLTDAILSALADGLRESHITHLDLSWNSLKEKQMEILAQGLVGSPVIELNLSRVWNRDIKTLPISPLLEILPHTSLTRLILIDSSLTAEDLSLFLDILPQSKMTSLSMTLFEYSLEKFQMFMQRLSNSKLKSLEFTWFTLGDRGLDQIEEFLENRTFETLILNGGHADSPAITPIAFQRFKERLLQTHLQSLSLTYLNIGDEIGMQIAEMIRNEKCKLSYLNLMDCRMTEKGILAIAEALPFSSIKKVLLQHNATSFENYWEILGILRKIGSENGIKISY